MELIKRYRIGMDDLSDKYKLLDKEVTVAEAVESAENYINSIYPYTGENGIKTKVYDVYVYKIKIPEKPFSDSSEPKIIKVLMSRS